MNNFMPDSSQLKALSSWYHESNPLYKEARHPVIKLAGEAGELLDLYGKHEYKPNFSWWNCKYCGYGDASHSKRYKECLSPNIQEYTPLVLDELGDYSYYLRILCWQKEVSFEAICEDFIQPLAWPNKDILLLLSWLNDESSKILTSYTEFEGMPSVSRLSHCIHYFLAILSKLDVTLEQVLDLNYKKLNSDTLQHGWANAR